MHVTTVPRRLLHGIERWVHRHEPTPQHSVELRRRRIFILPTRAGLVLAVVLLAMFVGATNYANSLAFLLTFLLTSIATLGMWHTHRNLLNLCITADGADPVFAGQQANFRVKVANASGRTKNAVGLSVADAAPVFTSLAPEESDVVGIPVDAAARGLLRLGRLTVFTAYPLGLFEAWSRATLDLEVLVYPRPAGSGELPPGVGGSDSRTGHSIEGHDDFGQLRGYSPGDSPKHVAWKASARGEDLLTKRFVAEAGQLRILDWSDTPGSEPEHKLSQLTRWVLKADATGTPYALNLPGTFVPANIGPEHRRRCLRRLALWRLPSGD